MPIFVRFISTVVALVVFGWSTAIGQSTKSNQYRTPFIIPMSSPELGRRPELPPLRASFLQLPSRELPPRPERDFYLALFPNEWEGAFAESTPIPPEPQPVGRKPVGPMLVSVFASGNSKSVSLEHKTAKPNVSELADRIAAYNLSVAAIEDQLNERETWDLDDLEAMATQIQQVKGSKKVWSLYLEILSERQQRRLGNIAALHSSFDLLRQRIFEVRVAMDINPHSITTLPADEAAARLALIEANIADWSQQE